MKIGIISDTHKNLKNTLKVLDILNKEECQILIHCGDFSGMFIENLKHFNGDVHACLGNNDRWYNRKDLDFIAKKNNITLHGDTGAIEINEDDSKNKNANDSKIKIGFAHEPILASKLINTNKYDIVCHGHTHIKKQSKVNSTIVICPGEIGYMREKPTYAILDTKTLNVTFYDL